VLASAAAAVAADVLASFSARLAQAAIGIECATPHFATRRLLYQRFVVRQPRKRVGKLALHWRTFADARFQRSTGIPVHQYS